MTTKIAALADRARRAKEAKLNGNVDEFIQSAGETDRPVANQPQARPIETGSSAATEDMSASGHGFAALSRGRITTAYDDTDMSDSPGGDETTAPPPPSSGPVVGNRPSIAQPSPASAFSSLARTSRDRPDLPRGPGVPRAAATRTAPDPPWYHAELPAGSLCSPQEWAEARALNATHCIFEFRNGGQSALLSIPRAAQGVMQRQIHDKKVSEVYVPPDRRDVDGKLSWLFAVMWDGCLILAPSATTTHPGAIAGEMSIRTGDPVHGDMTYRIVRPQSHQDNESLSWLHGIRSVGSFDPGLVGHPSKETSTAEGLAEAERERCRG